MKVHLFNSLLPEHAINNTNINIKLFGTTLSQTSSKCTFCAKVHMYANACIIQHVTHMICYVVA